MQVQKIKINRINPALYNPRKNLKPDDAEYQKLLSSMDEFGYVDPLIWNKRTGNLVGGHQRFKILLAKGLEEIDVSVVDLEPEKEKALNLALNKAQGMWDNEKLAALLDELSLTDIPMAILSNKPDEFLQAIVKTLFPDWEFSMVRGALPDVPIKPDPMAALDMLHQLGVMPSECLYVGDTNTDMQTAVNAGMFPVGVAWGFRDEEELIQSGAQAVLQCPDELMSLLSHSG